MVQDGLLTFRRTLLGPLVEDLSFDFSESDSPDLIQLRIIAVSNAANADDPKTISEVQRRFNLLLDKDDASQIPVDLQCCIYGNAVRTGGVREWEKILNIYRNFGTQSQKIAAMLGLASAQDPALIQRTLDLMLSDEVKAQEYPSFFAGSTTNPNARRGLWEWIKKNLATIVAKSEGNMGLDRIIQSCFVSLSSFEDIKAIEEFFKDKDTSAYARALEQGLDEVRSKAAWLERDSDEVERWLKKNKYI